MRRIHHIIKFVLAALLISAAPLGHAQDAGPMFVKVFAGPSEPTYRDFKKAVRKNLKAKVKIPDETIIECKIGDWYGLGVIVSEPGKQFLSFETTAFWRDLESDEPPRKSNREHSLRKSEYGTRRFFFEIRSGSVDHDMTFVAHIGKQVYLRHKFLIRGCEASPDTSTEN